MSRKSSYDSSAKIAGFSTISIVIIILMAFVNSKLEAQERISVGFNTELADKNTHNDTFDYGFNIGGVIQLELANRLVYVRARTFYFPELNDISYFDFDAGAGLNWRDAWDENRIYAGVFAGAINRQGWGHGKVGIEVGYTHWFGNFYTGVKYDYQYKHDDKIWRHKDSGHSVNSYGVEFGMRLL
jgi:hypothetical protein